MCQFLLLKWRLMKCFTEWYHIVVDKNNKQTIKTFTFISYFWYTKASYWNSQIGHLYYNLVTSSVLFSLKQLSEFSKSLICIIPYENIREIMMKLFNSILFNEEFITYYATKIIKVHILQVCHQFMNKFQVVQKDLHGSLQNHIKKIGSDFKKQGVYLTTASIAALFEYDLMKLNETSRSILWQALCKEIFFHETSHDNGCMRFNEVFNLKFSCQCLTQILLYSCLLINNLSNKELAVSALTIFKITSLWSVCLFTALQSDLNENYYLFLHINFIFLWSLADMKKGMLYIKLHVLWKNVCFFLNKLAKTETMPADVWTEDFSQPDKEAERSLSEDFTLQSQMYIW